MRLKRIVLFFVLILLLCETSFLYEMYETLRNIGSKFEVVIDEEDPKKIGPTKERLRTVSELRLRKEGITIAGEASLEIPCIYVIVSVVGSAYNINLMIREWVELKRLPSPKWILVGIWSKDFTGIHARDPEYIVSSLNILFDEFFNDYYKANPKEKKEARSWN